MKQIIIYIVISVCIPVMASEEILLPDIQVDASVVEKEPLLVMQETVPGMKQPVINGLMGDKVLITINNIKYTNALFRSGPNQYYSWVPDQFVLNETVNETLFNASLGGTVNRTIGVDSTEVGMELGYNTFTATAKYADEHFQTGVNIVNNKNVVSPHDGEVPHSSYNQKAIYLGYQGDIGQTNFLLSQSDDIDRTDKFAKHDFYVYRLQRLIFLSHEYIFPGSDVTILPSIQQFREKIDRDSPQYKNIESTNTIFGLNINSKKNGLINSSDVFKYGITNYYEDIFYKKGIKDNKYYYNTLTVWAQYSSTINHQIDYSVTYNFSILDTKGGNIDRNMKGNAYGISFRYYYDADSNNIIYGSFNSNFKFPTITNLAEARSDSVEEVANPYLSSEKAITGRIGYIYNGLNISIFRKKLYDMIIRVQTNIPDGKGGYKWKYENSNEGYINGVAFLYDNAFSEDWSIQIYSEFLNGKTDYDYISKLQPITGKVNLKYKDIWAEFLFSPPIPDDKMALKDKTDIRIKNHNYGYRILNMGYNYQSKNYLFHVYIDNIFNDRGRVYGSSVDFNERRVRFKYTYFF